MRDLSEETAASTSQTQSATDSFGVMNAMDKRIIRLVKAINTIPGISTYSSCGGHTIRRHCSQAVPGCFAISISVEQNDEGWDGLNILMYALEKVQSEFNNNEMSLICWPNPDASFELHGKDWIDPNLLTEAIYAEMKNLRRD